MASFVFLKGKSKFAGAGIDWDSDVIRAIPIEAVPDPDVDEFVDDISGDEIGSSRLTLTCSIVEDAANDWVELDASDFTFSSVSSGTTMVGFVVYKQVGGDDTTPGDDPLIAFLDTTDIPTNGGDIDVTVDGDGLIKF